MNLLKKYTPHEMMEMTIRDIKRRQEKKSKEAYQYEVDRYETIKRKMRRRK